MSKNSGSKFQHTSPTSKFKRLPGNQRNRELTRNRGREARREIEDVRQRIQALARLHEDANQLVAQSQLPATLKIATSHMDVDELCAHAAELNCRLLQLELQLAQAMREAWREDCRLTYLAYALELQERVGYLNDQSVQFELRQNSIVVSAPGVRSYFTLDKNGLNACAASLTIHEHDSRKRKALNAIRQTRGD